MKFPLPTAVALFCAATSLAIPQANRFDNGLAARDTEGLDLSGINIEDIEIDYDPADFDTILTSRATIRCSNDGLIKRVKKEYNGKCHPSNSKGKLSAHNCKNKQGKSYLCVQSGKATCYVLSTESASGLSLSMFRELANSTATGAEISNSRDSVRHHIFNYSMRDKETGKTGRSIAFVIYQTERHGPQNGYRFCLVHEGYYIASPEREEGAPEDEIDVIEKDIPQGHEEMVILGEPTVWDSDVEGDDEEDEGEDVE
ncbi:hypothetical protein DL764_006013 [Monosporascus ibericus]|uniref:Autophagy-related protein 27 n=1 Tax=Monosporascus ibericus TaxID=155417 RepID=A0A4Q4T9H1_9PEZI|nr:hypothetical protein DL764_006013 [Monosporascus ibericus]